MFARSSASCLKKDQNPSTSGLCRASRSCLSCQPLDPVARDFRDNWGRILSEHFQQFEPRWHQHPLGHVLTSRLGAVCSHSVHGPYPWFRPVVVSLTGCDETVLKPVVSPDAKHGSQLPHEPFERVSAIKINQRLWFAKKR